MALVAFLRGINVGGHRSFRPSQLAGQLEHLDVVSIGAAGTFVIRRPIAQARLREELARRIPFEVAISICRGSEILELLARNPFADEPVRRDVVRFVSVLPRPPRSAPATPIRLPASGDWLLRVLGIHSRLVYGVYRRQMKAIGVLGQLDQLFDAPVTTRSWSTIGSIAKVLGNG